MAQIELGYGRDKVSFAYDEERCAVLAPPEGTTRPPLSDGEVGVLIDDPLEAQPLEEIIAPGERILVVVSDATRATASAQVVNLLARRLIALGVAPADLRIIFATGIHRPVTAAERDELLTP